MQIIYFVEDDKNIRDLVIYALKNSGFEGYGFPNASTFYEALEDEIPNLILLDIMLPDEDGITILQKLRNRPETKSLPIILLTAKSSEIDTVIGLDHGADDYITKPFGVMELISRIKAVLRRSGTNNTNFLKINDIILNSDSRIVQIANDEVDLTFKEFELLQYLMENKNIVISRESLLEEVWGFDFKGETRTVDVHIGTLRQKLGKEGSAIKTIRNVGYKLEEL